MMVLATLWGQLARLPRPMWHVMAGAAVLLLLWRWHGGKVEAAFAGGAAVQAASDRARFEAASSAAAAAQAALITRLAARQARISERTDHALVAQIDVLDRRHDDLRLRWAAYRGGSGDAGGGGATAVPGAAGGIDASDCAAAGWVSLDIAAAAALAADTAIAKDDAWMAWVATQRAAFGDSGPGG